MPVDREKEVLFIHIPRTGGTKIEQSLNMTFGGDDVRVMKHKLFGYASDLLSEGPLQHLTYKEMIKSKLLTQKEFNRCFKFAFVRNPDLNRTELAGDVTVGHTTAKDWRNGKLKPRKTARLTRSLTVPRIT